MVVLLSVQTSTLKTSFKMLSINYDVKNNIDVNLEE